MTHNKDIFMRLLYVLGLLAVFLSAADIRADEEAQSYYRRALCQSVDKTKIKADVENSLKLLKSESPAIEAFIKTSRDEKHVLADCFAKRFEITGRLGIYLEGLLKSGEPDALLFARQGMRELQELLAYFKKMRVRGEFLKSAPPEKILNVRDFGAKGDGVRNDAPAFAKALEAAKKADCRVRLFIPAGTYLFGRYEVTRSFPVDSDGWRVPKPDYSSKVQSELNELHIPALRNYKNLTIEGEKGSLLLGDDPGIGFFLLINCEYLSVKNLEFDYRNLPFTQGTIVSVDGKNSFVTMRVDDGYPAPDLDYFLKARSLSAVAYDASATRLSREVRDKWLSGVKDCGNGLYAIRFGRSNASSVMAGLEPGQRLVISARNNKLNANILKHIDCSHLLYENLRVYCSPCEAFGGNRSSDTAVISCRVAPREGSTRLLSCAADPFLISSPVIGPYLADNIFERVGDDFSNAYVGGCSLDDISPDGRSFVTSAGRWAPGQTLSLLDSGDGMIKAEAVIVSVKQLPNWKAEVTVEPPFTEARSLKSLKKKELSRSERNLFDSTGGIHTERFPDVVIHRFFSGSGTIISNNVFRYGRGSGIFTKVPNCIVEGNTFDGIRNSAENLTIFLCHYLEPYQPHTVIIRGNVFKNNGSGISSGYRLYQGMAQGLAPMRDILIEGNSFDDFGGSTLRNCRDVRIIGNKFDARNPIHLECVRNVSFEDNRFALPESQAIAIGADVQGVSGKENFFGK